MLILAAFKLKCERRRTGRPPNLTQEEKYSGFKESNSHLGQDVSLAGTPFPNAGLVPVTRQPSAPKIDLLLNITIPHYRNLMPTLLLPPISLVCFYSITTASRFTLLLRVSSQFLSQTKSDVVSAFPEMLQTYSDIYLTQFNQKLFPAPSAQHHDTDAPFLHKINCHQHYEAMSKNLYARMRLVKRGVNSATLQTGLKIHVLACNDFRYFYDE